MRENQYSNEWIAINPGSTSEIVYYKTFLKLGQKDEDFKLEDYPLFGFNASPKYPLSKIVLPVRAGTKTLDVEFLVVKLLSSYNIIMSQMWLHVMKAIPNTYHQLLWFPRLFSDILRLIGLTKLQKLSLFDCTMSGIAAIWYTKLEDSVKQN